MPYRYPRFTREILFRDLSFRGEPSPGQPLPDFELATTEGDPIRTRDLVGRRPLLLTCASVTCPMAIEAGPALRRLYAAFGEHVAFVTLYVREAHPGEHYPQPATFAQKVAHARAYRDLLGLPWPVAVDSLDGDLHRALDPRPNAAYLMAAGGTVAFRALASNAERVLRAGLEALVAGEPLPRGERQPRVLPALRAIGVLDAVLGRAGPAARRDFRRALPPAYALVCLAPLFYPLPPLGRGVAALATGLGGLVALPGGLAWLLGRRNGG